MSKSPIADLSYRHYDGPLDSPQLRWWAIAKSTMRIAFKKKSMWVFMALSAWYYLAMIFVLFFIDQVVSQRSTPGQPNPMSTFFAQIVWKDQFMHGLSYGQINYLAIILILGAGSIANDNRANALLVYLSKPMTKLDYLMGKWVGIFLPVLLAMSIPSLIFYFYGAMSYREQGFLSQDPWLIVKLLTIYPLCAAFHASMIVGFSSLFSQGRLAGAAYAGFYFLSNFFTHLMGLTFIAMSGSSLGRAQNFKPATGGTADLVQSLSYLSIDGLNIGLTKGILNTKGSVPFGIPAKGIFINAPNPWVILGIMGLLSALSLTIAWSRIRAVEVVGR